MRVVTGKSSVEWSGAEFDARAAASAGVWVDVGTGDGALPYRIAAGFPDWLCLGLDPNAAAMAENARKAARKPARGGRENCLYVAAGVEALPVVLAGRAGVITINFPWAALLRIVLGDDGTTALAGLGRIAGDDCALQLLVNEVTDLAELPAVDPAMLRERVEPALREAGFRIDEAVWLAEGAQVRSRWGGRLIRGSGRRVVRLRASRGRPSAEARALIDAVAG